MSPAPALTPLDAAFLYIESDTTPLQMATVGIFEGAPFYDERGVFRLTDIRRLIESRLSMAPKLRQRPQKGLFGQAPPRWVDHPDFDIAEHVRVWRLDPPASEAELTKLCADLMAVPLDRSRPLWDLTFIEGLEGDRVALFERIHHAMADGLAAAELATVLLDLSPSPPPPSHQNPWRPDRAAASWRTAAHDLMDLAKLPLGVAKWSVDSLAHPIRRVRELSSFGVGVGTVVRPSLVAPSTSLTGHISAQRKLQLLRFSLEDVRNVAHCFDATINDVVLTMAAGGLRALLAERAELPADGDVQALVPVGLVDAEGRGLGNDVSALFIRLPVRTSDPVRRLRAIAREVGKNKRHHQALAATTLLRALEPVPQGILAMGARLINHQPFFNVIVTNVPGPPVPLYALGARLLEAFPVLPLVGNQSLAVAILSYDGKLDFGVLSDPLACPDVVVFTDGVQMCLESLREAAQLQATQM